MMDKLIRNPAAAGVPENGLKRRPSRLTQRAIALAVLIGFWAIAYGAILTRFDLSKAPGEVEFGAASAQAPVRLYLQPIGIDPVNDALQIRISVIPDPASPEVASTIAGQNFLLNIRRGKQVERVEIKAGQPLPEVTYDFDLDGGDIRDYPLDRYVSDMTLVASTPGENGAGRVLPIRATIWEGLLGFQFKTRLAPARHPGELALQFRIRRTDATLFFGLAIYGAMLIMALCALTIGSLVFVGLRRIEVTLVGALGAMIFALPALRNTLPGSPPLGVRADILVFFWAELGAIIAICLLVVAWARHGDKRHSP